MTCRTCRDVPAREERAQQLRATMGVALHGERIGRVAALTVGPELRGVRIFVAAHALRTNAGQTFRCSKSAGERLCSDRMTGLALEWSVLPGEWELRPGVLEIDDGELRRVHCVTCLATGTHLSEVHVAVARDTGFRCLSRRNFSLLPDVDSANFTLSL